MMCTCLWDFLRPSAVLRATQQGRQAGLEKLISVQQTASCFGQFLERGKESPGVLDEDLGLVAKEGFDPQLVFAWMLLKGREDEAKAEIKEIRRECEAKVAEKRIMMESECLRLAQTRTGDAYEKIGRLRTEFAETKRELERERDERIEAIREGTAS